MGRTNPTFRDVIRQYHEDWQQYRRGLRTDDKPVFDAIFADAKDYADAAGHLNAREPMHPILVSMLLAQKRQLQALHDHTDDLEARIETLEAALDAERGADSGVEDGPDVEREADAV